MDLAFSVLFGSLCGGAYIYYSDRRTRRSWYAEPVQDEEPASVRLLAGPRGGKTVTVRGLPRVGSYVLNSRRHQVRLVGGAYLVLEVGHATRTATASWKVY